jgi:PPK2 family polyphosphate:nucleotide phosphotransferase
VKLSDYDPGFTAVHDREQALEELKALNEELSNLQELLAAARLHSLLIILQGMDTSGKDGTIRHVLSHVNPQGCTVQSFKAPTEEEQEHDFLWRIHKAAPRKGMIGIFNRSHYEDVLIVRVHNLVPEEVWSQRYKAINQFEKLLADNNTIILKFYLHISAKEQERRLLEREQDSSKAWKVAVGDWKEREFWKQYQLAYEDALSKCSAIPWYIVPADHKWYRNLAIAKTLVKTMRTHRDVWKEKIEERGKAELTALRAMRDGAQK